MDILLKLIDVGLTYQTNNTSINVLKNINLDIKFKETISVIGESGSGKTSLIMLIGGLEKNTSGKTNSSSNRAESTLEKAGGSRKARRPIAAVP